MQDIRRYMRRAEFIFSKRVAYPPSSYMFYSIIISVPFVEAAPLPMEYLNFH